MHEESGFADFAGGFVLADRAVLDTVDAEFEFFDFLGVGSTRAGIDAGSSAKLGGFLALFASSEVDVVANKTAVVGTSDTFSVSFDEEFVASFLAFISLE